MRLPNTKKVDATTGTLWQKIIIYTIPIILGALVQNGFNAADLIVLGNMADSTAVASIGATSAITSLLVNSSIGIATGSQIILSKMFGAKDQDGIHKATGTSLITALGLGFLIVAVGIPLAPKMLYWTDCPNDCLKDATVYLRLYIMAAPAILLYNFGTFILKASGDSKRPLYYIIISGLANIILNIILCLILSEKVVAVAIATTFSQIIGAVLTLRCLFVTESNDKIILSKLTFCVNTFKQIMFQGLPLALNSALHPLSDLQIQAAINSFGISAIAGNSASSSIEGIFSVSKAFSSTAVVFIGQNMGARQNQRARQAIRQCLLIGCSIAAVLGILIYSTGNFWLALFLPDDPTGVAYGKIRMFYVLLFMAVNCAKGVYTAALQDCGYALFASLNSILGVFGFRLFWMRFVYPHFNTFHMLMASFLVSWFLVLFGSMAGYHILCKKKLRDHCALPSV